MMVSFRGAFYFQNNDHFGWLVFANSVRHFCLYLYPRHHRWRAVAVSFAIKYQRRLCLESFSKKFEEDVTAERGDHGNFKIGSGEDIFERPNYAPFLSQT